MGCQSLGMGHIVQEDQTVILADALRIAEHVRDSLAPHCARIEIAGSIRRRRPDVGDIEIVCIPKFELDPDSLIPIYRRSFDFIRVVDGWEKVKGAATGKYCQRIGPDGMKLDIFIANPDNFGLILAIRTGSAEYSHRVLATGWVRNGYKSVNGMLTRNGAAIPTPEETDLFRLAGVPWTEPEKREVKP